MIGVATEVDTALDMLASTGAVLIPIGIAEELNSALVITVGPIVFNGWPVYAHDGTQLVFVVAYAETGAGLVQVDVLPEDS